MKAQDAIRKVVSDTGKSQAGISKTIGKTRNYVNAVLHQADANDGTIGCDKAAAILGACGYTLATMPYEDLPESAIVIDPPSKAKPSH